ncbi:nitroreductase family protein [Hydrogenoanaerobacterium sp.]|uniref:nitroreductase family protein n=1 Tax=Hydrogenoanaerobacterium sp. TaxID=2953763 RepID=UPI00289FF182|nr:nitroreductase family protein [Hydrogenoanaerobacterium sp.]
MDILTAIKNRHSVRNYIDKAIDNETLAALKAEIDACNKESGFHIQLVANEPKAFEGMMANYGKFSGVQNYIALVGRKDADFDEKSGYYGERIALKAQMLGLNTCWVAMTFSKGAAKKAVTIHSGEKLGCVLALGYGKTQGVAHKSKPMTDLCETNGNVPEWFKNGMEAAMLAPTATNQQKFIFTLSGDTVTAKATGGFYSKVDLGIVKYHFEIGSGRTL